MSSHLSVAAAGPTTLAVGALLLAAPLTAQVRGPDPDPPHADFEAGEVSSWFLGLRSRAVVSIGGELFDSLRTGIALGVETGMEFDNRYSVRLALTGARYPDDLTPEDASTVDLTLEPSGAWRSGGWLLEAGAIAGYGWVDRGIQTERVGGWVVGVGASASRAVSESFELGLVLAATWSAFQSPTLVDHPPDLDGRAAGHRIGVGVRLARRWPTR